MTRFDIIASLIIGRKKDVRDILALMWADITTITTRITKARYSGQCCSWCELYCRQQLIELIPQSNPRTLSPAESLKVLADFGHFFFGSVWDTFSKL